MGSLFKSPVDGRTVDVPPDQVDRYLAEGYTPVGAEERAQDVSAAAAQARQDDRGALGTANAALTSGLSGLTLGGSDLLLRGVLDKGQLERLRNERAGAPIASAIGEGAGAVTGALASGGTSLLARTPAAAATRIGARITRAGEGAGTISRIGRATAGGTVEGGLFGVGHGIGELALSDDPLTVERAASVLSSNAMFGGAVGGVAGGAAKALEIGLVRAKGALDKVVQRHAAQAAVPEDLANLDRAGLKALEDGELAALESDRIAQRQVLADEIGAFREETKAQKIWLATKKGADDAAPPPPADAPAAGPAAAPEPVPAAVPEPPAAPSEPFAAAAAAKAGSELPVPSPAAVVPPAPAPKLSPDAARAVREIGKISLEADKVLDRVLRNPKALAQDPKRALAALQQQEHALERLASKDGELRLAFAGDTSGARAAALDAVPEALERNRALQSRIEQLVAKPTSQRLEQIRSAVEAIGAGGRNGKETIAEQMATGAVFGVAAGAAAQVPGVGDFLAPFAGAAAARFVGAKVFGRMAGVVGQAATRSQNVAHAFVQGAEKALPRAPVVATKVLQAVSYAPPDKRAPAPAKQQPAKTPTLVETFRLRAQEIRSQTVFDPMRGEYVMRPEAREAMASRLDPIRAVSPLLADQMETIQARKLTLLARELPKRPDMGVMQIGPDRWTPGDMEMRKWARLAAALEDPAATEERLLDGSFSPEDAMALREVYPERLADLTRQIVEQLPTLQKTLPYKKRLALSILTGVPVDPAMHPGVLRVLQRQHADEPGTEGGTQAPIAKAQFGSVRAEAEAGTPSQQRQGAMT